MRALVVLVAALALVSAEARAQDAGTPRPGVASDAGSPSPEAPASEVESDAGANAGSASASADSDSGSASGSGSGSGSSSDSGSTRPQPLPPTPSRTEGEPRVPSASGSASDSASASDAGSASASVSDSASPPASAAADLGEPAFSDEPLFGPPADDEPAIDTLAMGLSSRTGRQLAAWLELGIAAGGAEGGRAIVWSPELGLRYRVADVVVADVTWGLAIADTDVAGTGTLGGAPAPYDAEIVRVDPGNPVFTGRYAGRVAERVDLEVGLGVAVPIAARAELGADADGLAERAASEVSHRAAIAMRGGWSPWRFAPERVALVLPLRVATRIDRLTLEGDAALGVMIPALGDGGADVDVVAQLAVGAGAEVVEALHLGARVAVVGGALGEVVPGAVVSAEPWVRVALDPVHLTLRGVIAFNGEDGVAGPRGPGYGVFVGAGVAD